MGTRYSIIGATIEQVRSVGGADIKEARSTGIIFATLTEEQAAQLKALGGKVEPVGKVNAAVMPPAPVAGVAVYSPEQLSWLAGLEDLRQKLTKPPLYGEGFNLAIVDTGIRETHERIRGRVVYRRNFSVDPMMDGFDHGTGIASIAVAVAPLCNILNIKVLDNQGKGSEEEVVLGIDHLISLGDTNPELVPSVINLSLGSPDDGNPDNPLRVVCRAAVARGIWVSAAAGNSGPNPGTIMSPACEKYVFATGSARYEPEIDAFTVSAFSSRGPTREGITKPDALFFGEDIVMASSAGDTAAVAKSGTSFATPFNSGMAILYHEGDRRRAIPVEPIPGVYPELQRRVTIEELIDSYLAGICVKPRGASAAKDNDYGYGLPFGPLVAQAIGARPAVDLSAMLAGFVLVGMVGTVGRVMR